jgi:hypothetical protein
LLAFLLLAIAVPQAAFAGATVAPNQPGDGYNSVTTPNGKVIATWHGEGQGTEHGAVHTVNATPEQDGYLDEQLTTPSGQVNGRVVVPAES